MHLIRLGQDAHRQKDDNTRLIDNEDSTLKVVHANFEAFGLADERKSDFAVEFDWSDVHDLVFYFARMKHPAASRLYDDIRRESSSPTLAGLQTETSPQSA
jgi:hypothetical protein